MAGGFFATIFRFLIFIINFAFVVLGGFLVGIGVNALYKDGKALEFAPDMQSPMIFYIILGGLVFLVAFFGCCGAFKEDSCMLRTYASLVTILLILQIVAVVLVVKNSDKIKEEAKTGIQKLIRKYEDGDKGALKALDDLQNSSQCCGAEGPTDYKTTVPNSCCKDNEACNTTKAYQDGCVAALEQTIKDHTHGIKIVGGIVIGFQVLSILTSFCLAHNIRRQYDVV